MKRIVLLSFLITFIICSCSTTKQKTYTQTVYDTIYHTNTEYVNQYVHDSIYKYDTISTVIKGDTAFIEKWHYEYRDKYLTDTVIVHDTVYMNNKENTNNEKVTQASNVSVNFKWMLAIFCIAIIAYLLYKLGVFKKYIK